MASGLSNVEDGNFAKIRHNFARIKKDYGASAIPVFSGITITGLTDDSLIYPSGGGLLTSLGVASNGQLPIGSTGATPVLAGLTGTANQITVTNGAGSITLATPQDIHTGASPTFAGMTLTGITDTHVLYSNANVLAGNAAFTFNGSTGVVTITGVGGSGLIGYDLKIGDTSTPDYGLIQTGDAAFGRVPYNAMGMDLDGSVIIRNLTAPATSNIEFAFLESGGTSVRFALAVSAAGNATYSARSMLIAGPSVWDDEIVTVGYWQTNNNIFDNLACDTSGGDGADLGVQNDLEVEGDIFTDSIKESTSAAGTTFANSIIATSLTASRLMYSDGSKVLSSVSDLTAWIAGTTDHISVTDDSDGSVTLDLDTNTQTLLGSFNGIFLEKLDFTISEAGGTVTGTLEQDGGGDLIQKFSTGYSTLDCTPAKTVNLTAYVGTDAVPKEVFVYILRSASTVIVASNTEWPLDPEVEHIKIAHLVLKSAATTGTDGGALVNQNHNDYASDASGEGHLQDIEHRLRQEPAVWDSGTALTLKNAAGAELTTTNSSTAVELVVAHGHVFQIHRQSFPAFDMYSVATDDAHIVNQPTDSGGAFVTTEDLVTDITRYVDGTAAGVAIGTNKYFNLVVWGVQNRDGEPSHLMINLPTGQYTTSGNAVSDVDGTSIFTVPSAFKGVGFLIARLTFRLIGGSQWTYIAQEDLRGKFPDIIAGVGITTTDHALLANLIAPADDHTQYLLADGTRALAGAWDMGSQILTNVNIDTGDINVAVTNTEWDAAFAHVSADGSSHSAVGLNTTHRGSDGSDHSFLDQAVTVTGNPQFDTVELLGAAPDVQIHNTTETDAAGGRACTITFRGEQADSTESTLGSIKVYHATADTRQFGTMEFYVNEFLDGDSPTLALKINPNQKIEMYNDLVVDETGTPAIVVDGGAVRTSFGTDQIFATMGLKAKGGAATDGYMIIASDDNNAILTFGESPTDTGTGYVALYKDAVGINLVLDSNGDSYFNGGNVGINDASPGSLFDVNGDVNTTDVYKVDDVQVVSNRVIDARCDDVINSGDATTDGVIDALRDAMITHGLIAAA